MSQGWPEAANAETGEVRPQSVHDTRALLDETFAFTARAPRVLILDRGYCSHGAVVRLAAQPAEKGALEQFSIEAIRLRPPMLTRDGDARRMNDMDLDLVRTQPACQPEAIATGLKCNGDALDGASSLGCFLPPAMQELQ